MKVEASGASGGPSGSALLQGPAGDLGMGVVKRNHQNSELKQPGCKCIVYLSGTKGYGYI